MSADELNDVRLSLHAMETRLKGIAATVERLQPLVEFGEVTEKLLSDLPAHIEDLVKRIEADPMLGTILGPLVVPTLRAVAEKHRAISA